MLFTAYPRSLYQIPNISKIEDDRIFDGYFASFGSLRFRMRLGERALSGSA